MNARALWTAIGMTIAIALPLAAVAQQDPCAGFTWNVERERALFATPATTGVAWIDVVAQGLMVASGDHQGQTGCHAPHKIVQFALPANQELLVQLSGNVAAHLRLTVTRADGNAR